MHEQRSLDWPVQVKCNVGLLHPASHWLEWACPTRIKHHNVQLHPLSNDSWTRLKVSYTGNETCMTAIVRCSGPLVHSRHASLEQARHSWYIICWCKGLCGVDPGLWHLLSTRSIHSISPECQFFFSCQISSMCHFKCALVRNWLNFLQRFFP